MANSFSFNQMVIIQSLGPDDRKTGTELYNDIIKWQPTKHPELDVPPLFEINSLAEFRAKLAEIAEERAQTGVGMILHLEMHGEENQRGVVLNSGELMTWLELGDRLRNINIATHNNLMVTMATCYGGWLLQTISPLLQAPMYFMLGSMNKEGENENDLLEAYTVFYETLFDTFQIGDAYVRMRRQCGDAANYFWPINEEDAFFKIYGGYLTINCTPAAVEQRAKESISREGRNRAEYRQLIQNFIKREKQERARYYKQHKDLFFMMDDPANQQRFSIPDNLAAFYSAFKKFRTEHPWFWEEPDKE